MNRTSTRSCTQERRFQPDGMLTVFSILALVSSLLTGCLGNNQFCAKDLPNCPDGQSRDGMCTCSTFNSTPHNPAPAAGGKPAAGPGNGTRLWADCICRVSKNRNDLEAIFKSPPWNFDNLGGKTVQVFSGKCSDVYQYCPVMEDKSSEAVTGVFEMKIRTPRQSTDNYGAKIWTLESSETKSIDGQARLPEEHRDNSIMRAAFIKGGRLEMSFRQPNVTSGSCVDTCRGGIDADCAVVAVKEELQTALGKTLSKVAGKSESTIEQSELVQMFGMDPHDPAVESCRRGGTRVDAKGVWNNGEPCLLKADIRGLNVTAALAIPARLEGHWETRSGSRMTLVFDGTDVSPTLTFLEPNSRTLAPINSDYGGRVVSAESGEGKFFLKTESACVGIRPR
jgi:hypothetical protein